MDAPSFLGEKATGMRLTDDLSRIIEQGDVVIDFTALVAAVQAARICGAMEKTMVVAWSAEQRSQIEEAVKKIPYVLAPKSSACSELRWI